MKRKFRIIAGMLLLTIPLCLTAQVKPTKPDSPEGDKPKVEKPVKPEKPNGPEMKPEKPGMPEKPKSGLEMPKISGFVQGMYQANLTDEGKLMGGDETNTFRMRRVRLSVDGKFSKTVSYKVQGDFVRSPMLVDAYLKYKPCNEFAIQVGQFKTPFTLESPINPVNLEIFDYGEAVQKLVAYNDVCGIKAIGRDIGVMATGSLFPIKGVEGFEYNVIDYAVGVFNGNGINVTDNNNRKDIVGRLEVHPGLKALTLSGSYYYGLYRNSNVEGDIKAIENGTFAWGNDTILNKYNHGTRNRWTIGAQYNDGNLVVRGEYINGMTNYMLVEKNPLTLTEKTANSDGYYAQAGYYFHVGEQKIMPVLRYEHFTANDAITNGGTNWYTAGINYWPMKSVNFKLDYSLVQKESGTNSHRVVGILSYKF